MTKIVMDVESLGGVVTALKSLYDTAFLEWTDVGNAAGDALTSSVSMTNGLGTHLPNIMLAANDLQMRIDLAILYNMGADGTYPSGELAYEVTGTDDTTEAIKGALGVQLAQALISGAVMSADGLTRLDDQLARHKDDPLVMTALFDELGPEGLLTAIGSLEGAQTIFDDDGTSRAIPAMEKMRDGLETATNAWTPAHSATYAKELVEAAAVDPSAADNMLAAMSFPSALAYLLYDSTFSDPFLASAAETFDSVERSGVDGDPFQAGTGPGDMWLNVFPEGGAVAVNDPALALMSALGNNPQVSLDFFMGGSSANDEGPNDRQMYWLHNRDWSDDEYLHLSEALVAATTSRKLTVPADSATAAEAAFLASQTVNLLGHRENFGDESVAASENLAQILSTYMYGVDVSVSTNATAWDQGIAKDADSNYTGLDPTTGAPHRVQNVPYFNTGSLDAFIGAAAGSDEGLSMMRTGLSGYSAQKYDLAASYLAANPGAETNRTAFELAYESVAGTEGVFVNAVGDSAIADAIGEDALRKAWVEAGSELIGAIPIGGGVITVVGGGEIAEQAISFVAGQATARGADHVTSSWADLAEEAVDTQNSIAAESLRASKYQVFTALVNQGMMSEHALDGAWQSGGELLSWQEFNALPASERTEGWERLVQASAGPFDESDFDLVYANKFQPLFDDQDAG